MSVIPALVRLRQAFQEFEASLGYKRTSKAPNPRQEKPTNTFYCYLCRSPLLHGPFLDRVFMQPSLALSSLAM